MKTKKSNIAASKIKRNQGAISIRALITGICGQDGSFLAEFLLKKGYEVFGFSRPIESDENIKHLKEKVHMLQGDLMSQTDANAALKEADPDEIYNLGAISHVGFSFNEPVLTGDVTGLGVARMLHAIKNYNTSIKFYQASTSELFGRIKTIPQNENTPFHPASPYAVAKLYGYWMTRFYREAYNIFACNGILYNHESERRGFNFVTRKITSTAAKIKLGMATELRLGNLDAKKDWGYANDFIEAMWLMLQHKTPDDFVIGTGELHTVKEFVQEAFKEVNLNWEDYVKIDKNFFRPIDTLPFQADYTKAREILKWKPKTTFKQLVKLMVRNDIKLLKRNANI